MLRRLVFILMTAAFALLVADAAPEESVRQLKRQQQSANTEIARNKRDIKANKRETRRQLRNLDRLHADIDRQNAIIADARERADSVNRAIAVMSDSIEAMKLSLGTLRTVYAASLRRMQPTLTPVNRWAYLFSSESIGQFFRRIRYLRQLNRRLSRYAAKISTAMDRLENRQRQLAELQNLRTDYLQRVDLAGRQLAGQEAEAQQLVRQLRTQGQSLESVLRENRERSRRLETRIETLLAQEEQARQQANKPRPKTQKKSPAASRSNSASQVSSASAQTPDPDRRLSGSFESNKGRLLFPVASRYKIARGFGIVPHIVNQSLMTRNAGIDIEVSKGASARAVFEGTVTRVDNSNGEWLVMVRHGAYITIYVHLAKINVNVGQKVSAGQTIGTVYTNPQLDNLTILHFEIRHDRNALNPLEWVR